jgi:hypothetical protein
MDCNATERDMQHRVMNEKNSRRIGKLFAQSSCARSVVGPARQSLAAPTVARTGMAAAAQTRQQSQGSKLSEAWGVGDRGQYKADWSRTECRAQHRTQSSELESEVRSRS